MRVGLNPERDKLLSSSNYIHQVIIPIHIPNNEGYFKESFQILKFCLQSLFKTCHPNTFISLINNGCNAEVSAYLEGLFRENKIQEVVQTSKIGKLNAILKGISGHNIPMVTIADADVLFLSNWQNASYAIFNAFPKTGVVGLTPQFKLYEYFSGNALFDNFFSKKLKYTRVKNSVALQMFYKSIGWEENYNREYLNWNLSLSNNNIDALLGSGHYVATYRREIFDTIKSYIGVQLGLGSEQYLDDAPLKYDLWRLTTAENYAYHMGNVEEIWMQKELGKLHKADKVLNVVKLAENLKTSMLTYTFKNRFFVKFLSSKKLKKLFYKFKGLPEDARKDY